MAQPHAIVIGYGPGIGEATSRAFAAEGYSVALMARDAAKVDAAAKALKADGLDAVGIAADAGDENSLVAALEAARDRFGDPAALVYNAARFRMGSALKLTREEFLEDFRAGTAGALTAARIVVPAMQAARKGSILFTGGGFALFPSPEMPGLSVSKAGVRALASILAQELAPSGIRVGTVTVMGHVTPGTALDAAAVAQAFLALHRSPVDPATFEIQLR